MALSNLEYLRRIPSYDQMKKLVKMLSDAGIPHEYKVNVYSESSGEEWHDVKIPDALSFNQGKGFSVILNGGSFGHSEGLLEVWHIPDEKWPTGGYTAEAVFQMIQESMG